MPKIYIGFITLGLSLGNLRISTRFVLNTETSAAAYPTSRQGATGCLSCPRWSMRVQYGTPFFQKDIIKLDTFQRRAGHAHVKDFRTTSRVTQTLMESLGRRTLEERRKQAKTIVFYRGSHSLVAMMPRSLTLSWAVCKMKATSETRNSKIMIPSLGCSPVESFARSSHLRWKFSLSRFSWRVSQILLNIFRVIVTVTHATIQQT